MANTQVRFMRVNPMTPSHALADDEVASATNVDFDLGQGALVPRRGCQVLGTVTAGVPIWQLFRNYNNANNISANAIYAVDTNGAIYRGSASYVSIISGGAGIADGPTGINSFQQYALIASKGKHYKDDGTNTTEWIKQVPAAPVVTVSTLTALSIVGTNTYAVTQGTSVSGSSTRTFTPNANFTSELSISFGGATTLNSNGGHVIGDFGIHFVDLAFSNPDVITRISQDYSIGDANFYNFWHAELDVAELGATGTASSAFADPNTIIDSQLGVGTSTSTALTSEQRDLMVSQLRSVTRPNLSGLSHITGTMAPWGVGRTEFAQVGKYTGTAAWSDVYAVRYTIEGSAAYTGTIANSEIRGSQDFPLNDTAVGYTWWKTYATLDASGIKIGESAPSPPSGRLTMQQAQAIVTSTTTATGTSHGINAEITYRQGGYTNDAYAVSTLTYTNAVSTFTDTTNDIQALSNNYVMLRSIQSPGDFSNNVVAISEPFGDRVFVAENNHIHWSLAGQLDAFPATNYASVANIGDNVKALVAWPPGLVVVNQNSVFELSGSDFDNGLWTLLRSGARKGSIPAKTCIKTPYGIPLLNYDGLSMYLPGQGVDTDVSWLTENYGDMFKGGGATDPAARKGSRIPAINHSYMQYCLAAYGQGKLYIAAPTGTSGPGCNTVYVIDFNKKQCWWYTYDFAIWSMFWDYEDNRLLVGTHDGRVMRIEIGTQDSSTAGDLNGIAWLARTKRWTTNADTVMENISIDMETDTSGFVALQAIYDTTNSVLLSTLTQAPRNWVTPPMGGTFAHSAEFTMVGFITTGAQQAVYELSFDLLPEPVRVSYYRTTYDEAAQPGDKLWDVAYYDLNFLGPGSMQIVQFVDNTAVMTSTVSASTGGRVVIENAFPPEIYGRVAYTTASTTSTSSTVASLFKWFDVHYDSRPEPAKVNYYRTDIDSLEENIVDAFDVDINPNGTVFGTAFVDNTAITTGTFTGTKRQSFTWTTPVELYGRTLYVSYTGTAFKHYKTWFHKRLEPDRWTNFVSSKQVGEENEWKVFKPELNCLGNTVLCTAFVNGASVGTYTAGGSTRTQYTFSLPVRTFGREVHGVYNAASGTFKHYSTSFDGSPEPPRTTTFRTGPYPFPSSSYLKTWQPLLDPLGATVLGTLIVDDTVLLTGTFTGSRKQWFTVGLDLDGSNALNTASRYEVVYSAGTDATGSSPFKHYETKMEIEPKPFGKKTWAYSYRKLGGASQIDMARYWSLEAEASGTTTCTYYWDINGTNFTSGTVVLTGGIQWFDREPLPPGGRGYIFLFKLQCGANNVKVYKVNLDLEQEGIKHLVRRETQGTPASHGDSTEV